jgi:hypothetical protein
MKKPKLLPLTPSKGGILKGESAPPTLKGGMKKRRGKKLFRRKVG